MKEGTELHIDRLALEGDGVARLTVGPAAGKVAFVPYALPGEDIRAFPLSTKKDFSRWLPVSIERASPSRVKPRCSLHFQPGKERWCGGCDWQHLSIPFQRSSKIQLLAETLTRLGGVANPPMKGMLSGPSDWRYRNKVQVPFQKRGPQLLAGFFAPGSHTVIDFDDCPIQPDLSVQIVRAVKSLAQELHWPIYDEDRHRGWFRHLLVRTNEADKALVALVATSRNIPEPGRFLSELRRACPDIIGIHINIQAAQSHVILGPQWARLWGVEKMEETMCGLKLRYSPGSFFQVNTPAAALLYNEAIRQLDAQENDVVLDLYCGVGAMTLLAAQKTKFAIGIEETPSSIRDAEDNARENKISNVKFVRGEVERWIDPRGSFWGDYLQTEQVKVIVDPPRTGCRPEVINRLLELGPKKIVYVSCNPATLARDVKMLSSKYTLAEVTPIDLFPQTSHIEAVARLDKK